MFGEFTNSRTLMIQGCTSDAGKSVLTAGLGRLLARNGLNVAPFKPQNMALNSAVTREGGEIGRAQALQAQACYLQPHTDFNPVLLKPDSDTGAQVIVHGHAVDIMQASQFHDYKKIAMQAVLTSHTRLVQQYSMIIVEGAGSPAEINLRDGDIANMGFAEAVDCPVVLIADIDRGGVFAHLVGTLELLSRSEQNRIIGFIINRFRGDIELLNPGLDWLEQKTGKPVIGVVPYLHELYLDAEDAVATQQPPKSNGFKVVVPVLPRISNHTDFDALRQHPKVDLQFVSINQDCPAADLIILPGSKNVIADLKALRDNDWHIVLNRHLRYGGKLIGVCGGYQMLGLLIDDPYGIENNGVANRVQGFGYLSCKTTLRERKQLTHTSARLRSALGGAEVTGYEIHCGITTGSDQPAMDKTPGQTDGAISDDNLVFGTYLHGLFDRSNACNAVLSWAGLNSKSAVDIQQQRDYQLDRLADCLEKNLTPEFLNQMRCSASITRLPA